jgi:hypothetical protein
MAKENYGATCFAHEGWFYAPKATCDAIILAEGENVEAALARMLAFATGAAPLSVAWTKENRHCAMKLPANIQPVALAHFAGLVECGLSRTPAAPENPATHSALIPRWAKWTAAALIGGIILWLFV